MTAMKEFETDFALEDYNYAFLDEGSKREIRRKTLKAVAIPGYQVPFASRELPIGRGWGTGGLQLTLSLIGRADCLKVIDQGSDNSVNAASIRKLIKATTRCDTTADTAAATIIQTRHRIPEERLRPGQILVLQVPIPEPLRLVEPRETVSRRQHADMEYSGVWLRLYEDIIRWKSVTIGADYPVLVHNRYLMSPTPIPRFDNPKLHRAEHLSLFGAGREKKIYAVPPYTDVVPLSFEDYPFEAEAFGGHCCKRCGSRISFMEEVRDEAGGETYYLCTDTNYCDKQLAASPGMRKAVDGR